MEWIDTGLVLGTRRLGEADALVELMTRDHGRHLGVVKGGRSKRWAAALQIGNRLRATWRARLDDRELRLYRTNHALLGCFVPPGRHELSLEMTSPKLRLGLLLFVLGGAALAILISWSRDRDPA